MIKSKKQQIISIICFIIGFGVVCSSLWFKELKQIVHFTGAMMMTGSMIFWDGWFVIKKYKERAYLWRAQIRLLIYVLMGIVLLKVPVALHIQSYGLMLTKALGMALLLLAMWKFYSFTTRMGGKPVTKAGCEGTGNCANCGREDICSSPDKRK